MQTVTLPPAEKLGTDLDPRLHSLFFGRMAADKQAWIEQFLTVPDLNAQIVPFKLFPQQKLMLEHATGRDLTTKGRQSRTSSLYLGDTVREWTTHWGFTAIIGAHDDATTELFRQRIKHHLRDLAAKGMEYKLSVDNDDEMVIGGMDSRIVFQSGERRIIGRSITAQKVHFSEIAHWRKETAATLVGGLIPSVPGPPNGAIDFESTPHGAEGLFYEAIIDAKPYNPASLWTAHFYGWWLEPRYRVGADTLANIVVPEHEFQEMLATFQPLPDEARLMGKHDLRPDQILWRRLMMAEMAKTTTPFLQEFPESLEGCFLTASGNYFATPDGFDHLEPYRLLVAPPVMEMEKLPYNRASVDFGEARLAVWEFPDPTQVYCLMMDCASGEQGDRSDFTAITVLNATTLHKAARFRAKITPADAGVVIAAVGEFYGNALAGIERGGYGSGALDKLREILYPNIYYQYDPMKPVKTARAGIYPTADMREKLLQTLRTAVLTHSYVTKDALEVQEMGTFDWTKVQGRMKAQAAARGTHDDILMATAGALFIAPEARARPKGGRWGRATSEERFRIGRDGQVVGGGVPNPYGPQPWMF